MFTRPIETLHRWGLALRTALAAQPAPCWMDYLHETRERG
jgi:hypothetical protein